MPKATEAPKQVKIPSTLTLTEHDLPAIKDWKVGQTYHVMLEVKQVGADAAGSDQYGPSMGKTPHKARFTIVSAKTSDSKMMDKESKSEDMGESGEEPGDTRKKVMNTIKKKAGDY